MIISIALFYFALLQNLVIDRALEFTCEYGLIEISLADE